jgi:hypothetical protein
MAKAAEIAMTAPVTLRAVRIEMVDPLISSAGFGPGVAPIFVDVAFIAQWWRGKGAPVPSPTAQALD